MNAQNGKTTSNNHPALALAVPGPSAAFLLIAPRLRPRIGRRFLRLSTRPTYYGTSGRQRVQIPADLRKRGLDSAAG